MLTLWEGNAASWGNRGWTGFCLLGKKETPSLQSSGKLCPVAGNADCRQGVALPDYALSVWGEELAPTKSNEWRELVELHFLCDL